MSGPPGAAGSARALVVRGDRVVLPDGVRPAAIHIREGRITDTKTVFGLLWWDRFGSRTQGQLTADERR